MRAVEYRHNWGSGQTREEEMEEKFGKLLVAHDTSEDYQEETSSLFFDEKTDEYVWIDSNGCSCWDGDYDGWALSKEELLTLADKAVQNRYEWRDTAAYLVGAWVQENIT